MSTVSNNLVIYFISKVFTHHEIMGKKSFREKYTRLIWQAFNYDWMKKHSTSDSKIYHVQYWTKKQNDTFYRISIASTQNSKHPHLIKNRRLLNSIVVSNTLKNLTKAFLLVLTQQCKEWDKIVSRLTFSNKPLD